VNDRDPASAGQRERGVAGLHLALAAVQVLFATNAVVGRIALRHISPTTMLAVRVPSAALLFVALRWFISRRAGWQAVGRADLWRLAWAGLLGVSLNQLLFFEGLARSTATNAVVINSSIPVFAAGFAMLRRAERPTLRRIAGLAVALTGALLVALLGRSGATVRFELGLGELFLTLNSAAYALYLVESRPLFQRYRTDTAITWIFVFAATLLLPLGLGPLLRDLPAAPPAAQLSLAYIVIGPTVGAYFLNGYALRRASTQLVAIYIFAQPAIAALLAAALLDERIHAVTLAGAALIGTGIALVSLPSRQPKPARP